MSTALKYDIVQKEGDDTSVTVFHGGKSYIATPDHPKFGDIVGDLRSGKAYNDPVHLIGLFDVTVPLAKKFDRLSERVLVGNGRIYFDGVVMDDSLTQAIIRFYSEGNDNFKPLVAFLEKLWTNPMPHSREQLYRWLAKHEFAIAPDGDFYAFKGVRHDGKSSTAGEAIVNGVLVNGNIPNEPDTIIEMPRDKVVHDPRVGCSTGLHAGSWSYASSFGPVHLLVKINPRDVVSVPTDSSDQKIRTSRYRVVKKGAQLGDVSKFLRLGDVEKTAKVVSPPPEEPEKPKRKRSKSEPTPKPPAEFPKYYEEFGKKHFDACETSELRWLAKEWEIPRRSTLTRGGLVNALVAEARKRKRTWKK